jgi:hypothetical protein
VTTLANQKIVNFSAAIASMLKDNAIKNFGDCCQPKLKSIAPTNVALNFKDAITGFFKNGIS